MHALKYAITNVSPLVISSRFGDMNMVTTEKYIPGRSVLGILAQQFIRKQQIRTNAHKNDAFYRWFLSGTLEIGPAYIVSKDENDEAFVHFPIPFSVQKKKNEPEIIDLLHVDEDFDEQTEGLQGFCRLEEDALYLARVETSLNFHHARDRETGTSRDGIIFNYESIAPGQTFEGVVLGPGDELEKLLRVCGKKWTAHIGRSRNAQYGRIDFEILDTAPQPFYTDFEDETEVSLTLLSDAIILNENGFSTTRRDAIDTYLPGAEVKRAFIRQGQVENFVGIWQQKRPSETCLAAGSSFLLDISNCRASDLSELQIHGIGERTHEGFGRCVVGLQEEERLTDRTTQPRLRQPHMPLPETTKGILTQLALTAIEKAVELRAMEDAKGFSAHPPSRSLCGRLEAMARGLDQHGFVEGVKGLRASAKNQLTAANNREETLYGFLTSKTVSFADLLKEPANLGLADVCKKAGLDPSEDKGFERKLYRLYFCAFFAGMRKTLKKGGAEHDR